MRSPRLAAVTFSLDLSEPLTVADPQRLSIRDRVRAAQADDAGACLPVARAPDGQPIVRGTSVTGALRDVLRQYRLDPEVRLSFASIDSRRHAQTWSRPATLADLLLGSEPEEQAAGPSPALRASPLRVVHTTLAGDATPHEVTRTAISRRTGTAVATKLFRREHLDGASIDVTLQVDLGVLATQLALLGQLRSPHEAPAADGPPSSTVTDVVQDLVTVLRDWSPRLGGLTSSGAGQATVTRTSLRWGVADPLPLTHLLTATTTLQLLTAVATEHAADDDSLRSCQRREQTLWRWELALQCTDPLLIAPQQSADQDNAAHTADVVRGSTWRGLLRARCEFILRSLGHWACESSTQTCGECLTCLVFGSAPPSAATTTGAQSVIRFSDSPVTGSPLTLTHAPIDRFTGGAAAQKLLTRTSWALESTTTLVIEQQAPGRPVPAWARDLLVLAVRDLVEGYVGVGNSTTRGYGTVALAPGETLPAVQPGWTDTLPTVEAAS